MSLPVPPFDTPYSIELQVNLDDATDDRRRIVAEVVLRPDARTLV